MTAALIKFLGGLQTGSEAVLPHGEYILGADDTADLVLVDVAVKPRHAILTVGDVWEIEPADGAEIRLDGVIIEGRTAVAPYQVLSFGGVHIALGPDGPWEVLPDLPRPSPGPGEREDKPAVPKATRESDSGKPALPRRRAAARFVGTVAALAMAYAVGYLAYNGYPVWFPEDTDAVMAEQVRHRLAAAGFPVLPDPAGDPPAGMVAIRPAGQGRMILTGLLATEADRRRAVALASLPEIQLEDATQTVESQVAVLAGTIRNTNPYLGLSFVPERWYVNIAGVAESPATAESAYRLVRAGLHPRIGIRRHVWHWRDLAKEAEREAKRLGIEDARFTRENGVTRLSASNAPLAPEMVRDLAQVVAERFGEEAARFFATAFELEQPVAMTETTAESPASLPSLPEPEEDPEAAALPPDEPETVVSTDPTEPNPPTPLPRFWHVAELYKEGFRDQTGKVWRIGDLLPNGSRLTATWHGGILLQQDDDLLFVQRGATFFEETATESVKY